MSTALEQMHEIEPRVRIGRARAAVIMLIVSDGLSVLALLAAGGYLNTLNVSGQFRGDDHPPALLPSLLLAIVLALSGIAYYLWDRSTQKSDNAGQSPLFIASWVLMLVGMVAQFWIAATLGYGPPFHAYASLVLLLNWFSAVHLLLASFIGLLVLGRIFRGRLDGRAYIAQVVGYWWYYTIVANLLMWFFILILA